MNAPMVSRSAFAAMMAGHLFVPTCEFPGCKCDGEVAVAYIHYRHGCLRHAGQVIPVCQGREHANLTADPEYCYRCHSVIPRTRFALVVAGVEEAA